MSLIDVAPTILELVGAEPEPRFEGRSLVPFLTREASLRSRFAEWIGSRGAPADRDIVLELPPTGSKMDLRLHHDGLVRERQKLLVERKGETRLFDLEKDPEERAPIASDQTLRGQLHEALTQHLAALAARANPTRETQPLDEATKEKLRALGYH